MSMSCCSVTFPIWNCSARHRLRTHDSILLATGIRSGATAAITNDNGWKATKALAIEILLLSQLVS